MLRKEIQIDLDETGQYHLQALQNGKPYPAYIPNFIADGLDNLVFVVEEPVTMQKVINDLARPGAKSPVFMILETMHKLRLCILKSLISALSVPAEEVSLDLDNLLHKWQTAFEMIPAGHQIYEIQLDLSCESVIDLAEMMPMLHRAVTAMRTYDDRPVAFSLIGCHDSDRLLFENICKSS